MGHYPGRKTGWFETFTILFGMAGVLALLLMILWGMARQ